VGACDPLEEDSQTLVGRLGRIRGDAAGSHTRDELVVIPGVSHAYLNVFRLLPEGVRAMRLSAQWVKEALHTEINTRDNGYANVNARL
jgi:hypothetical protein